MIHAESTDILIIGEPLLELFCEGALQTTPVFGKRYGGDSYNTATALQRLGLNSIGFVTRLGDDPFAQALSNRFMEQGFNQRLCKRMTGRTGICFVSLDGETGARSFQYVRQGSAACNISMNDLPLPVIQNTQLVFSTGVTLAISESAKKAVIHAFKLARQCGVTTAFDPNYRSKLWETKQQAFEAFHELLPYVDIILPSAPEDTYSLYQLKTPRQVMDYFALQGVKVVVVKAGADGAYIRFKGESAHIPTLAGVVPKDTTGAGDAFNGGFFYGLINQVGLIDCVRLGNATAALKVQAVGSADAMPKQSDVFAAAKELGFQFGAKPANETPPNGKTNGKVSPSLGDVPIITASNIPNSLSSIPASLA